MEVHYDDIWKCENLPESAVGNITGLLNFGNCVRFHSCEDCKSDSVDIQGGDSTESIDLGVVESKGKTKSYSAWGKVHSEPDITLNFKI